MRREREKKEENERCLWRNWPLLWSQLRSLRARQQRGRHCRGAPPTPEGRDPGPDRPSSSFNTVRGRVSLLPAPFLFWGPGCLQRPPVRGAAAQQAAPWDTPGPTLPEPPTRGPGPRGHTKRHKRLRQQHFALRPQQQPWAPGPPRLWALRGLRAASAPPGGIPGWQCRAGRVSWSAAGRPLHSSSRDPAPGSLE